MLPSLTWKVWRTWFPSQISNLLLSRGLHRYRRDEGQSRAGGIFEGCEGTDVPDVLRTEHHTGLTCTFYS